MLKLIICKPSKLGRDRLLFENIEPFFSRTGREISSVNILCTIPKKWLQSEGVSSILKLKNLKNMDSESPCSDHSSAGCAITCALCRARGTHPPRSQIYVLKSKLLSSFFIVCLFFCHSFLSYVVVCSTLQDLIQSHPGRGWAKGWKDFSPAWKLSLTLVLILTI